MYGADCRALSSATEVSDNVPIEFQLSARWQYLGHVLLAVILTLLCLCTPYFVDYVRTNDLLTESILNFIIGKTGASVRSLGSSCGKGESPRLGCHMLLG